MKNCPSCSANYEANVDFCPHDGTALRSATGLEPGSIIRKKYQILAEIGRGGMGVVYRVRHLLWNEDKAIKVLLDAEGARTSQGFRSEALLMRQFQHPNIVRVEDVDFTEDDRLFVVMEYVEGESLQQRMRRGPISVTEALDFAAQACEGLSAAHAKGVIHRDIKPENLLLTKGTDGREVVKLIDFGIAKVREDAGLGSTVATMSQTGSFIGTPEYSSPEQALGMRGNELDGRTDIYSLGLLLYEMLTDVKPFAANTLVAALLLRLQNQPASPRELRPEIPRNVSDLVLKAMARERESRYGSADEMRLAIESILHPARGAAESTPAHATAGIPAKRNWLTTALAGVGVAVLLVLAAWFFWPRPKPAPPVLRLPAVAAQTEAKQPVPVALPPPTPEQPKRAITETKKPAAVSTPTSAAALPPPSTPSPEAAPVRTTGETKVNPKDGLKYVWIAPGKFRMGCSPADNTCNADENPAHEATLTKPFWIGETEVTQSAYERVTGHNPSETKGADLPVTNVSWFQANSYCKDAGMRLLTEVEWEYAARGGVSGPRNGKLANIAWWVGNSDGKIHPVAQKLANGYGLYDMLGNVAEWVADWYATYPEGAISDPQGPPNGELRIARGGSAFGGPIVARLSTRLPRKPSARTTGIGIRCAGE